MRNLSSKTAMLLTSFSPLGGKLASDGGGGGTPAFVILDFLNGINIDGPNENWESAGTPTVLAEQLFVSLNNNESDILRVYNHNAPGIPLDAVITGYVLAVSRIYDGTNPNIQDTVVRITCPSASALSENKATSDPWPAGPAGFVKGSSSDLWGLSLTPAQINSGLEVNLASQELDGVATVLAYDAVNITVHYLE
jgi:hypothetical protein